MRFQILIGIPLKMAILIEVALSLAPCTKQGQTTIKCRNEAWWSRLNTWLSIITWSRYSHISHRHKSTCISSYLKTQNANQWEAVWSSATCKSLMRSGRESKPLPCQTSLRVLEACLCRHQQAVMSKGLHLLQALRRLLCSELPLLMAPSKRCLN